MKRKLKRRKHKVTERILSSSLVENEEVSLSEEENKSESPKKTTAKKSPAKKTTTTRTKKPTPRTHSQGNDVGTQMPYGAQIPFGYPMGNTPSLYQAPVQQFPNGEQVYTQVDKETNTVYVTRVCPVYTPYPYPTYSPYPPQPIIINGAPQSPQQQSGANMQPINPQDNLNAQNVVAPVTSAENKNAQVEEKTEFRSQTNLDESLSESTPTPNLVVAKDGGEIKEENAESEPLTLEEISKETKDVEESVSNVYFNNERTPDFLKDLLNSPQDDFSFEGEIKEEIAISESEEIQAESEIIEDIAEDKTEEPLNEDKGAEIIEDIFDNEIAQEEVEKNITAEESTERSPLISEEITEEKSETDGLEENLVKEEIAEIQGENITVEEIAKDSENIVYDEKADSPKEKKDKKKKKEKQEPIKEEKSESEKEKRLKLLKKNYRKNNRGFLPFNLVALVLSVVAILSLFMGSLFKVDENFICIHLNPSVDTKTVLRIEPIKDSIDSLYKKENSKSSLYDDFLNSWEPEHKNITIKVEVSISTKEALLDSILGAKKTDKRIKGLIEPPLDSALWQLEPPLREFLDAYLPVLTKAIVKDTLNDKVQELTTAVDTLPNPEKVDEIIDKLFATEEKATVEEIKTDINSYIQESFTNEQLSVEQKEEVKQEVEKAIDKYADKITAEDGTIDIEKGLDYVLDELGVSLSDLSKAQPAVVNASSSGSENDEEDPTTLLIETLKAELMDKISKDVYHKIGLGIRIVGYVLWSIIILYAIVIVLVIVKFFTANKRLRLNLLKILSILPFMIIVLLPKLILTIAKSKPNLIDKLIKIKKPNIELFVEELIHSVAKTTAFKSVTIVLFICGLALIFFSLFQHGTKQRVYASKILIKDCEKEIKKEEKLALKAKKAELKKEKKDKKRIEKELKQEKTTENLSLDKAKETVENAETDAIESIEKEKVENDQSELLNEKENFDEVAEVEKD